MTEEPRELAPTLMVLERYTDDELRGRLSMARVLASALEDKEHLMTCELTIAALEAELNRRSG